MTKFLSWGATCTLFFGSLASAQTVEGSMTFYIAGNWTMQSCYYTPATDDPIGIVQMSLQGVVISSVNTVASSNGDHCGAHGSAMDTVVGGPRMVQTANAYGEHFCSWTYGGPGTGEVELQAYAQIDGSVTLSNAGSLAAGLGYAEATSSLGTIALAVLTDSAAESNAGILGDVSAAYIGISATANVNVGTGTFTDSDYQEASAVACTNSLWVLHRSRAFIRVGAVRVASSAGTVTASASMVGDCVTGALLGICPE